MLAAAVPGGLFRLFVETISGDELEKLLKNAIIKHWRFSYAHFKDLGTFNITQEPTLSIKSGNFYRTVVDPIPKWQCCCPCTCVPLKTIRYEEDDLLNDDLLKQNLEYEDELKEFAK